MHQVRLLRDKLSGSFLLKWLFGKMILVNMQGLRTKVLI